MLKVNSNNIPCIIVFILLSIQCITYVQGINLATSQVILYSILIALYKFSNKNISFDYSLRRSMILPSIMLIIFLLFLRVLSDLEFYDIKQFLYTNNITIYFFIIFTLFIPSFFLPRITIENNLEKTLGLVLLVYSLCLFLSFIDVLTGKALTTIDFRFYGNATLSPIQYGHLGVSTILLSICMIRNQNTFLICLIPIFLGISAIFFAGTRSCIVALSVCLLIYFLANKKIKYLFIVAIFIFVIIQMRSLFVDITSYGTGSAADRILSFITDIDSQSSGRDGLYQVAIKDIIENPIFGKAYFFSYGDNNYVHNSLLEIMRAEGIILGGLFLIVNIFVLKFCYVILKHYKRYSFFALIFIQYTLLSMFSDSIIRNYLYWMALFLVLNIYFGNYENKKIHFGVK